MRKLALAMPAASILVLAVLLTLLFGGGLSQKLEEWTGETDFKQQVIAVYSEVFQRSLDTQDTSPVSHTGVNPFGVNVFLEQEVEDWKVRRTMEMIRESGAGWIRLHVPWADVETPAKGRYQGPSGASTWDKYDRIVDLAGEYGLNILARLDDPPDWTRVDNSVHNRPPDNFADFGDFVYTFVSRYAGRVRYYQIWNEPNVYPEWGNQPADASSYVQLLKTAYQRAKDADPETVVLAAPLSPTLGTPDGFNESDLTYLQGMYDAGARDYFDVMSVNAYGLWTGPGDRRAEVERTNFSRPLLVREIMVRNGDAGKSIWTTEMGWNALPEDFPGPATHGRVSIDRQSSYTVDAYRRAQDEWPWMGVIFYWQFRQVREEPDQIVYYYRMLDPDFTPQPVYQAFSRLGHEPPVLRFGYRQEDDWSLNYEGSWARHPDQRAVLGAYVEAEAPGAKLSFTFRGTGLDVVAAALRNGGQLAVTIDGAPAPGLARRQGCLAILEPVTAGYNWGHPVPLARGLPHGDHRVVITALSPGVGVDALIVHNEEAPWWRSTAGTALLLTCLVALVRAYGRK